MNKIVKKATANILVLTLTAGSLGILGTTAADGVTPVSAASNAVSLKKKSATLNIKQDGAKIKKETTKIKIKKKKGVKIKKTTYRIDDKSVAKVDKKGKITPKSAGAAVITVNVKYKYRKKTKTKKLNYNVKVKQSYKHVLSGLTLKFNTYATFVDGATGINPCYDTTVLMDEKFYSWDCLKMSIADTSIATMGENGLIIGKKPGTTTATISSTDGSKLSVTATVKVFGSRAELDRKDDLYNSIRDEFMAAQESGWTEEEKERYIDKDGRLQWSLVSSIDFQKESYTRKIVQAYTSVEKQPDNTPQDALNSIITTNNAMLNGDPGVEDTFLQIVRDKVVAPIRAAKTIDELIAVSEDLEKRGLVGFLKAKGFLLGRAILENDSLYRDVFNGKKPAPSEPTDMSLIYYPKISAPYNMAGYDFSNEKQAAETKKAIRDTLALLGFDSITEKDFDNYIDFLKEFSKEFYSPKNNDFTYYLNIVDRHLPNLKVREHLEKKGYKLSDKTIVQVEHPGAYLTLNKYLANEKNLEILKLYLTDASTFFFTQQTRAEMRIAYEAHPSLLEMSGAGSVEEAVENGYKKTMGNPEVALPWDLDHIYTDTVYPKDYKAKFEKMVQEYKDTYREAIQSSEYGDTFKANMLKKLDKMKALCLYPGDQTYKNYEIPYDLVTAAEGGNLADNLLKIRQYQADLECMTVGSSMCEYDWWYPNDALFQSLPNENNAYYVYMNNVCYFFHGGIGLNGLFFENPTDSPEIDAKNIGYMATTIGHEMGHAFDSNGCLFNEDGKMVDPWGTDDSSVYSAKVDKLSSIYDSFLKYGDLEEKKSYYNDGNRVIDEAMADLGGTEISLRLLKKKYPNRDDLIKSFFEYTAEQWMSTQYDILPANMLPDVLRDPHPDPLSRTNGVASMMDEFYRIFDVKETDAMYVAPEDRVVLWKY